MGHFDINKVKVNLKLALNRMKIQKQKKLNEIKASRRSMAELLRDGKEEVARVKVEAIIRDDMLLQAFEILELFVELLLSRIELLKMQQGCPFDMKEAVCTIIYAAPRLSQKELTEVRHQFIEKYGKAFASEAMENKGNCVNAKLIHKMSVITPDNNVVFEYLGSIAKEYKLDWTSPLSAQPGEMGMFPAPPSMPAPMEPHHSPYQPPPYSSFSSNISPNSNNDAGLASAFPSVPSASSMPPPYQSHSSFYGDQPLNSPPPPDYSFPTVGDPSATPGNTNDEVPGMDDLLARFNNLKK